MPAAGKRYGRQRRGGTARPAAPPRLPAARALPAHENEVLFSKNRADGFTEVAVFAAPAHVVRAEVHVPRVPRRVERTRPIVAEVARAVQVIVAAIARRREKDCVAVGAFHFDAVNAV